MSQYETNFATCDENGQKQKNRFTTYEIPTASAGQYKTGNIRSTDIGKKLKLSIIITDIPPYQTSYIGWPQIKPRKHDSSIYR